MHTHTRLRLTSQLEEQSNKIHQHRTVSLNTSTDQMTADSPPDVTHTDLRLHCNPERKHTHTHWTDPAVGRRTLKLTEFNVSVSPSTQHVMSLCVCVCVCVWTDTWVEMFSELMAPETCSSSAVWGCQILST